MLGYLLGLGVIVFNLDDLYRVWSFPMALILSTKDTKYTKENLFSFEPIVSSCLRS